MKKVLLAFALVAGVSGLASAQTGKAVRPESKTTPAQPATPVGLTNAAGKTPTVTPAPAKTKQKAAVAAKKAKAPAKKD